MAKDRLRYFRQEAREILDGLTKGLLELEKGGAGKEVLGVVLRLAHTLKGAAGVVKLPAVAEHAHQMEEVLEPHRGSPEAVPEETVDAALELLDSIRETLAELEAGPSDTVEARKEPLTEVTDRTFETIRIEVSEMEALLEGIAEATVQTDALRQIAEEFFSRDCRVVRLIEELDFARETSPSAAQAGAGQAQRTRRTAAALRQGLADLRWSLEDGIHRIQRELAEIRSRAGELRLLPAGVLFSELERAARDAAQSVGKKVVFDAKGGEERLDANVLAGLRSALLHVVRNAVVHGIETAGARSSAGKPSAGRVTLTVERRGHRVSFQCRDDGGGVQLEAVRRACAERGLLPEERARQLTVDEALRVIFEAGVTTTSRADKVSGRGVGLDVARDVAAKLKGQVKASSQPGEGMVVELVVPVSLTSLRTLVIEDGRTRVAMPFSAVRGVMRLEEDDIATSGEGDSVLHSGRVVPFGTLATLAGETAAPQATAARRGSHLLTALVIETEAGTAALGVDRLLGTRDEVTKPCPPMAGDLPLIAGASFDSEGNPSLVLDPSGVVEALRRKGSRFRDSAPPEPPPVLVVDDSLTTRMLEQTILEANGYDVDLASSGEEGLEAARKRKYGLCLCDVEMPGINGFEFVEAVRRDPELHALPVILMTTRSSEADRRRGLEAGATAYLLKGEFDESVLLRTIRGVIDSE